jgi:hypothetical protein
MKKVNKFIKKVGIYKNMMVWHELDEKKKHHLVNCHTVRLPKDCGGVGVLDLYYHEQMPVAQMAMEAREHRWHLG